MRRLAANRHGVRPVQTRTTIHIMPVASQDLVEVNRAVMMLPGDDLLVGVARTLPRVKIHRIVHRISLHAEEHTIIRRAPVYLIQRPAAAACSRLVEELLAGSEHCRLVASIRVGEWAVEARVWR